MATNMKLVGAVAIKVRPDTDGFRRDAEKDIEQQLKGREVDFKVKAKVKADTNELDRDIDRAKRDIEKKRFAIKVGLDYDSVRKAQAQVKTAMDSLKAKEIDVKFNEKGLEKAQAKLDKMMRTAKVKVEWANDRKGYEDVLNKIASIRREKITQTIEFGIDEASLAAQEALAKKMLRDLGVDITYSNNNASIRKAIAQIDAELNKLEEHTLNVKLDRDSLLAEKARLEGELNAEPVTIRVDYNDQDSLKKARQQINSLLSEMRAVDLDVNVSEGRLEQLRHQIDSFINDEEDKSIDLPVALTGLSAVAARIAYASRTRHVSFFVTVNAKSLAVAEGLLRSLAGLNVLTSTGRFLENMVSNFDTIAIKGTGWASAILSVSNTLVYMTTALFGIGAGLAKMVGLLATLPAIGAAVTAAVLINIMAFKNFKSAIDGDVEALAALPPAAAAAAQSLTGVWDSIQKPVQNAFWTTMGTSIQDFVQHVIPQFRAGLESIAPAAGQMLANVLNAFTKLGLSGDMTTMFANLGKAMGIAAGAAEPLVDAINTLGLRGSYFLPRMAQWLTDITVRFDNWIQKSEEAGDINRWIEEGVAALHATWEATGAVVDQFRALARAATAAGTGGLLQFRDSMRGIADIMLGEPFQTRMALFFSGSREGASALNEGIRALGESFGESAYWLERFLIAIGQLSGDALIQLSRVIGNVKFQEGLLTTVRGLQEAVNIMTPGFDRLGSIIGNLGILAGGIFTAVAPVINTVMKIVGSSLDGLTGSLTKLVPILAGLVNGILTAFQGPFGTIVNIINGLVTGLGYLPPVLQSVVVAFAGMFFLRGQFIPFFLALQNGYARVAAAATGSATVSISSMTRQGIVTQQVATQVGVSNAQIIASNALAAASTARTATAATVAGATTVAAFRAAAVGVQASFLGTSAAAAVASAAQTAALRSPALAAAVSAAQINISNEATAASSARLAARMVVANAEISAGASVGARAVTAASGVIRGALGTLTGAAAAAATGVSAAFARVGTAVAGGATRVATGAAAIGRSLFALAGGWIGIGIMAIGTAIAVLGSRAADTSGDVDALKGSLDELGRVTSETKKLNIQKLIEDDKSGWTNFNGSLKSASEQIRILGGSVEQMGTIATEGGPKFDGIIKQLEKLKALKLATESGGGTLGKSIDANAVAELEEFARANGMASSATELNASNIDSLIGTLNGLRDPTQQATSDWLLANDSLSKVTPRTLAWNDALGVMNDTASTSSRRVEALKDALDILNGKSVDGYKITRNYNDRVREMRGFLEEATKATEGLTTAQEQAESVAAKRAALNATINVKTGEINTSTDIGSDLSKQLEGLIDTSIEVAIKVKDEGGGVEKITQSLEAARKGWVDMASAAGISAENAGLAWDNMIGGIPKDVATTLAVKGVDDAGAKIEDFSNDLSLIDGRKAIAQLFGDDEDLANKILNSMTSVEEFDAMVATATADLDPTKAEVARSLLLQELAELAATNPTVKANIDPEIFNARKAELMAEIAVLAGQKPTPEVLANIEGAKRELAIIDKALDNTGTKRPEPVVVAKTYEADAALRGTNTLLEGVNRARPTPVVGLVGAGTVLAELTQINSYLTIVNGRHSVARVTTIFDEQHQSTGRGGSGGQTRDANGSIHLPNVTRYANGGFENHTAKIFQASAKYRLFAEPETGGEAYIPMSATKRTRSTAILKEVAARFGYELQRNITTTYANGTPVAPSGSAGGVNFHIANITAVDAEEAVHKLRVSQMDALAVAGISNGGAV